MSTMLDEVKEKVSIPQYVYNIIVPQMADYYSDYTVDFDVTNVMKCCLHDEDTPSMRYYDDTNTFFCFGCRAGGDVINLHRKFTEKMNGKLPSFNESVEFLYKYFIKGQESATVINKPKTTDEPLSDKLELMRLSNYIMKLDSQLMVDNKIKEEHKYSLWSTIDNIKLLVSKNKINASNAMSFLREEVRKTIV